MLYFLSQYETSGRGFLDADDLARLLDIEAVLVAVFFDVECKHSHMRVIRDTLASMHTRTDRRIHIQIG